MNLQDETIQSRAYCLYLERNGRSGNQLEDWLKAEKEIHELDTTLIVEKINTSNN
jgi:hypothetical protein